MWTAFKMSFLLMVLLGLGYPLAMVAVGQTLLPQQANGSLITSAKGQVIGSNLIGQTFSRPEYFHPRPSANNYDAGNSGGSNFGSTNAKLIKQVKENQATYRHENPTVQAVPVDAVTASGSGLDPHISLANALTQVPRVAQYRQLPLSRVRQIVYRHVQHSVLSQGPAVPVLEVNLALDELATPSRDNP